MIIRSNISFSQYLKLILNISAYFTSISICNQSWTSSLWFRKSKSLSFFLFKNRRPFLSKVKVENPYDYQDLTSVVAISNCYSTVEPFIDGRCDVYIQKIGQYYKAFM